MKARTMRDVDTKIASLKLHKNAGAVTDSTNMGYVVLVIRSDIGLLGHITIEGGEQERVGGN